MIVEIKGLNDLSPRKRLLWMMRHPGEEGNMMDNDVLGTSEELAALDQAVANKLRVPMDDVYWVTGEGLPDYYWDEINKLKKTIRRTGTDFYQDEEYPSIHATYAVIDGIPMVNTWSTIADTNYGMNGIYYTLKGDRNERN